MSEKTKEIQKFQDTMYMYTQSLHGETIYEYKLLRLFMSTFANQSMSIGRVGAPLWFSPTLPFLRH